jgi:hypothetical protein
MIDSLPPTVSKMVSVLPAPTLGPVAGRLKSAGEIGFATILAMVPGFTR